MARTHISIFYESYLHIMNGFIWNALFYCKDTFESLLRNDMHHWHYRKSMVVGTFGKNPLKKDYYGHFYWGPDNWICNSTTLFLIVVELIIYWACKTFLKKKKYKSLLYAQSSGSENYFLSRQNRCCSKVHENILLY